MFPSSSLTCILDFKQIECFIPNQGKLHPKFRVLHVVRPENFGVFQRQCKFWQRGQQVISSQIITSSIFEIVVQIIYSQLINNHCIYFLKYVRSSLLIVYFCLMTSYTLIGGNQCYEEIRSLHLNTEQICVMLLQGYIERLH